MNKYVEQPKTTVARARIAQFLQQSSETPSGHDSKEVNYELFYAVKNKSTFSVEKAHFLKDDDSHSVVVSLDKEVINWDKEGGANLSLIIDDEKIFEVDTKGRLEGTERLRIDGLLVDFMWDLFKTPKRFIFLTREFSFHTKAFGELGYQKDWEDCEHVNALEILADF
ncbi:hypothetical protein IEQ34_017067 [Dendrobium chrysotoxum]|uniref:Uncharacterized protein n=1 Tax=Dendrobium chrysotoxum TaxID=161865 RepID=A0AAV7GHD9_DENCH|nr:hypothetical protein IEQ34_017067 [Dendrobium chrysotoxum]